MTENGFDQSKVHQVTVIRLGTEFQSIYENQLPLLNEVQELAQNVTPARMVVELSAVEYFGSAFIGFLIELSKSIRSRDAGAFAVSEPTAFGQMALSTTKTHEIFPVFKSTEEAITSLASDSAHS